VNSESIAQIGQGPAKESSGTVTSNSPVHDEQPTPTTGATLRRTFLWSLIGSLILAAGMGIYAFLLGRWGETEVRILLTTLSISFCSMTALASAAAFARGREFVLSYGLAVAGVIVSAVTFLLFMGAIWFGDDFNEPYAKTMVIAGILSFSLGQSCLLGLASLPGHLRWVYWFTVIAITALAVLSGGLIVFEIDNEALFRVLGILGILDGCGTLTIPILARLYRATNDEVTVDDARYEISFACPQCGGQTTQPLGDVSCGSCGMNLRVTII